MQADSDQGQEHSSHELYCAPTDYLYVGLHSVKPFPLAAINRSFKIFEVSYHCNMSGEFTELTKRNLAKRAGERCSLCGVGTSKPHSESRRYVNLGEAAHIKGNKEGSYNRFDVNMSDSQRSDMSNAIWLCTTCHKKIDSDDTRYSTSLLVSLKDEHEKRVTEGYYDRQFPSFSEQASLEHDINIFKEADSILNEAEFLTFLNKIRRQGFIYVSDPDLQKVNEYLEFHNLEGKKFISEKLNSHFSNLRFAINGLLLRLYEVDEADKRYDSHLKFAHIGEPFFIGRQAAPEFSIGVIARSGMNYLSYSWAFNRFLTQLKRQISLVEERHREYRKTIKELLYI